MNCQRIQDECLIEALHDGSLPSATADAVRAHLAACPACRAQLAELETITAQLDRLPAPAAPSQRMRASFDAMLAAEKALQKNNRLNNPRRVSRLDTFFARLFPRRPVYQFGASLALLALGLFVGARFLTPASTPGAGPETPAPNSTAMELAELREQVNNMGRLVTYSLLQQKSTSERLQSVLATLQLKSPDRQLLTDLVGTLAFDPSVNVRLSAVEALAPHTGEDLVRAGLIAALPRETAPLVQVAMIELLASARDTEAAPVFARLMLDDRADPSVRETARRALAVLDSPHAPALEPAHDHNLSHTSTDTKTTT
ncbi:zf-HC2 domain-containing protein [Ereboglobus luteus]|uniref:Putative zinc-finger domain-containing protein n=1 Tax=Ereboglobus luteus TaxID=1796921 RepID=A0A2U8E132_9BACT|nr:zf-HC2 domain-containing protein [Ereboglobus luteus]AWI08526.1 hypothetical protein CKA38_04000 [Ereboglobus luteus]